MKLREQLEKYEHANIKYFELGVNLLKQAKQAKKIYKQAKPDEKKQLLGLVFSNLTLRDGIVLIQKEKPFELIAQRVENGNVSRVARLAGEAGG